MALGNERDATVTLADRAIVVARNGYVDLSQSDLVLKGDARIDNRGLLALGSPSAHTGFERSVGAHSPSGTNGIHNLAGGVIRARALRNQTLRINVPLSVGQASVLKLEGGGTLEIDNG